MDASRDYFYFIFFSERAARAGGGGGALPDFFFFFFPCSADHERDWPPCKVVFIGLATNALNVRKKQPSSPFSNLTHTSDDISELHDRGLQGSAVSIDATVTCAALRPRLSTNYFIPANSSSVKLIVLCPISLIKCLALWLDPSLPDNESASFNSFRSDHKLAVNCSGVGGSGRLAH